MSSEQRAADYSRTDADLEPTGPNGAKLRRHEHVSVEIWVPPAPGTYDATALLAPYGSPSVQAAFLTNPAGGGGDPPWLAVDGSITVTAASGYGPLGTYQLLGGTVHATLRRSGQPDLQVSGEWGCVSP